MYRCVGLAAPRPPVRPPPRSPSGSRSTLGERVLLDGRDVTDAIRTAGGLRGRVARGRRPRRARRAGAQAAGDRGHRRLGRRGPRHRHRRRAGRRGQGLPAPPTRPSAPAAARPSRACPSSRCWPSQRERDANDAGHGRSVDAAAPGAVELDTTGLKHRRGRLPAHPGDAAVKVAVVGIPNVGKKLAGQPPGPAAARRSCTSAPGITRDRNEVEARVERARASTSSTPAAWTSPV